MQVEYRFNDYRAIYVTDATSVKGRCLASCAPLAFTYTGQGHTRIGVCAMCCAPCVRRPLCAADTMAFHAASVAFLEREAKQATAQRQNMLVLTHHTPSFHGTADTSPTNWESMLRFGESTVSL
jgi:hypothetical protein